MKWLFDYGSAQVVGGTTVALTLMLGSINIQRQIFVAFAVLYLVLSLSSAFLLGRLRGFESGLPPIGTVDRGLQYVSGLVAGFAGAVSFGRDFPLKAMTTRWWLFIGLAFFVAVAGEVQRRFADSVLDDVDRHR